MPKHKLIYMVNGHSLEYFLKEVNWKLSQTVNDPNLTIICHSFTFCSVCGEFSCNCWCKNQTWNINRYDYFPMDIILKS